ncbi:MAG: CotH kinase family protein, partial [Muribaculaceae bacterium]|nr:CotH kinase family protein [Muribaculaceae bacterium]
MRGSLNGWGANAEYTFSREGNVYSIHMDALDGEFKISDADWNIEFGAKPEDDPVISSSRTVDGIKSGANYVARSLNDVNISFSYNPESPWTTIFTVSVNGVEPDPPEPAQLASGTLPILYINVYDEDGNYDDEVISKDLSHKNYFNGSYWLDLNGCEWLEAEGAASIGDKDNPLPLQIKARGNYTRKAFSKKPFKLKLEKKQSMLGLSKSKHFAILAHADDFFGYMRNFTGFNLGKRIGLPWTPWQQPVEVIINGDYRGLYFLTESIRVESDRVNIQELDDNVSDAALISGGYLVELDNYDEENQIRMEERGQAGGYKDMLRITFDTPEEYSDLQRMFVFDQFTAMNDAIGRNSDDLWKYMDLDDAARYYIVEEILSHTESYHGSTYLFRDRGEGQKWHFSPLWDCGNAFMGSTHDYFTADAPFGNTWIASMRMNHTFMSKVKETWKWFMSQKYDGIYEDLDEYASRLQEAANADYRRWHGQPMPSFESPQAVVDNRNMQQRLENVKSHLMAKNDWLRQEFGDYSDAWYEEPERDMTEAAPLPE